MKLVFDDRIASRVSMESNLERVVLESDVLANMLTSFNRVIPSFRESIINYSNLIVGLVEDKNIDLNDLDKDSKEAVLSSRSLSYINFGDILITVPENFHGSMLDYIKTLSDVTTEVYTLNESILSEYNAILSSFITNKDDKISLKDHTDFFKKVKAKRLFILEKLGRFTKDSGVSKVKLKSVISRMSDIEPIIRESINIGKLHNKAVITNVRDSIAKSTDLLDIIIKQTKNGDITNMSPAATLNISMGAYEVAKMVELLGIIYYDVNVLLKVVKELVNTLIKK
jgi:hypothetical protein